jgi:TonB family protein
MLKIAALALVVAFALRATEPPHDVAPTPLPIVYDARKISEPPAVVRRVMPVYPKDLKDQAIEGEAAVRIVVGEDGSVIEATSYMDSMVPFGEASVAAARQWTFRPGKRDGKFVRCYLIKAFVFDLKNGVWCRNP